MSIYQYEFQSNPIHFSENPLNHSAGFSNPSDRLAPAALPDAVQDLLIRFLQLAREIEPYVQAHADDTIYIDYRQGSWTETMLERFRREIHRYPAGVALLQFVAENAGEEVTYRDFLQRSSWNDVKVRTELGAISKVARKLFGKKVWPVRIRQGSDGVMRYFMPEGIAAWWMRGGSASRSNS